jgi:hypothetical protein
MIYDLVILNEINAFETISLLAEAINFTVNNNFEEFASTINWLYGVSEEDARTVLKNASLYLTKERMDRFMNIEGRIRLYSDKFGLKNKDKLFYECINNLFLLAKTSLEQDEKELFLSQAAKTIKDYGWLPPTK